MQNSRFIIAAHVITALAYQADCTVTSECLAQSVNTNAVVIRRLLRQLSRAGLISSIPGAAGGSRLARPAQQISLGEIYDAVEGEPFFALHPQTPNASCPIGAHIQASLLPTFQKAQSAFKQAINTTTVADLVKNIKRADAASKRNKGRST